MRSVFSLVVICLLPHAATAAPPIGWRNDGVGVYPLADPPVDWSREKNIRWKVELPGRSHASPVLVGNMLLVACEPTELICLRASDREQLWRKPHTYREVFGEKQAEQIADDHRRAGELNKQIEALKLVRGEHAKADRKDKVEEVNDQISKLRRTIDELHKYPPIPGGGTGNTAATPVSDGKHVWCVFAMGVVTCDTLEGEPVWARFVEVPGTQSAASPQLVGDKVIVQFQHQFALDASTGKTLWQQDSRSRTGTPTIVKVGQTDVIVNPSGSLVRAEDGAMLGKTLFNMPYISPIVHQGVLYAHEDGRTTALKLPNQAADTLTPAVRWKNELSARQRRLSSSVYHQGLLYGCTENGVLDVTDAATGEEVYRQRLPLRGGRVEPSLCIAGKHLFVFNNRGTAVVIRTGREYEEIAVNELEGSASTPVFSGKRIFVRAQKSLYCIEAE